jgi:hypothetical protein
MATAMAAGELQRQERSLKNKKRNRAAREPFGANRHDEKSDARNISKENF